MVSAHPGSGRECFEPRRQRDSGDVQQLSGLECQDGLCKVDPQGEREGCVVITTTVAATTAAERSQRVSEAIHSGEMEGLPVTVAGRQDAQEYVAGRISSDELVARARARYGLDRAR